MAIMYVHKKWRAIMVLKKLTFLMEKFNGNEKINICIGDFKMVSNIVSNLTEFGETTRNYSIINYNIYRQLQLYQHGCTRNIIHEDTCISRLRSCYVGGHDVRGSFLGATAANYSNASPWTDAKSLSYSLFQTPRYDHSPTLSHNSPM